MFRINRIPTKEFLISRGVSLKNFNQEYPYYGLGVENAFHLFAGCPFTKKLWVLFRGWWNSRICSTNKAAWEIVVATALWSICTIRNDRVCIGGSMNQNDILLLTKLRALIWIKNGNSKLQLNDDPWWEDLVSATKPYRGDKELECLPPYKGSVKCNIEGAFNSKKKKTGCGTR
ncbi:hypothetical protein GQ457_13G008940 [Hibiscus cannabinus]